MNRAELNRYAELLAEYEGRPATGPGSLYVEAWSPGDGWTRFRLYEVGSNGGQNQLSAYYNRKEFEAYLQGRIDGARDAMNRERHADTVETPIPDRTGCTVNPCTCHDDSAWSPGSYPNGCDCGCRWAR